MNINKIGEKITVRPTERKIKKNKQFLNKTGVLPKEMPIEKKIYLEPDSNMFERVKDSIQIALDKFRGQK